MGAKFLVHVIAIYEVKDLKLMNAWFIFGSPVLDARGYVIGIFIASNPPENYSIALPITSGLGPCRPLVKEGAAPYIVLAKG